MIDRYNIPIQFKAPLKILGPIDNGVRSKEESYALMGTEMGVIGYWPKPDVHPDGYWRLTEAEAQFIADACNEKVKRDTRRLARQVDESVCVYSCDSNHEIEDDEGCLWPCPVHGAHVVGRKCDEVVAKNPLNNEPMTAEGVHALLMQVANMAYSVAHRSPRVTMDSRNLNTVIKAVLTPEEVNPEVLDELYN